MKLSPILFYLIDEFNSFNRITHQFYYFLVPPLWTYNQTFFIFGASIEGGDTEK